jgi:hypothetical protein
VDFSSEIEEREDVTVETSRKRRKSRQDFDESRCGEAERGRGRASAARLIGNNVVWRADTI